MDFRDLQERNAWIEIVVTLAGIVIFSNDSSYENNPVGIIFKFDGNLTFFKFVQELKTEFFRMVFGFFISTVSKDTHPENAYVKIVSTELGIIICFNDLHLEQKLSEI